MSEDSSEKSPERGKGSNMIEEARRKVEEARGKLAKIRDEQAATRQALAKEIVDMAEGNQRLAKSSQGQGELGEGYREGEREKGEEIGTFRAEVQRGKEELTSLSQEMERIEAELKRDVSLKIDLPSKEDLQGIREAITQGEESLRALQKEYQVLTERHRAFAQEQEEFGRNPVKSASDTVFWAHEQLSGKNLSKEERNAIAGEVQQESQRRSQIEQQEYEAQRQRQEKERREKELTGHRERLASVDALFREHENSINEAVRVMEEELRDEMFLQGVKDQWSTIAQNHRLLKGGRLSRLLNMTSERAAREKFTTALDAFSAEHSKKYHAAAEIAEGPWRFVDKQTNHWEQESNLYNSIYYERGYFEAYEKSYFQAANPELDKRFKEFFKAQRKLVQEMKDFSVAIRSKISVYIDKLAEVFHKQELDKMDSFARRLPRI